MLARNSSLSRAVRASSALAALRSAVCGERQASPLGPLARGDIDHQGDRNDPAVDLEVCQAGFDGKRVPIPVAAPQLLGASACCRARRGLGQVRGVHGIPLRGQEQLDQAAGQLVARIAGHLGQRGVGPRRSAIRSYDDDAKRAGLKNPKRVVLLDGCFAGDKIEVNIIIHIIAIITLPTTLWPSARSQRPKRLMVYYVAWSAPYVFAFLSSLCDE
jgi:hypothetical protein